MYIKTVHLSKFGENRMKIEDLPKTPKTGPLGCTLGAVGQKIYQKFIWYIKMVLLSKFGENWMKIEDFPKNAQKWPPGRPWGGESLQKISSNTMSDILCKFGEDRAKNEEQF